MEHIRKAVQACSFPPWALNSVHYKFNHKHNIHNGQTSPDNQPNNNNNGTNRQQQQHEYFHSVPYIYGLGEKVQKNMQQYGDPGTLQGYQHLNNPLYSAQG